MRANRRITMRKKRHTPEEIVSKLRQVDGLVAQGTPVADAVRSIGVTEVSNPRLHRGQACAGPIRLRATILLIMLPQAEMLPDDAHLPAGPQPDGGPGVRIVIDAYPRSDHRTRLPDEFQTNQDQENVNDRVEAFARNAAHQQHTKPGRQNSERKESDR